MTRSGPQFGDTLDFLEEGRGSSWAIGDVVQGFEIRRLIARGGMSYVYEAVDPRSGRIAAIKALPPQAIRSEHTAARFDREIEILSALHHPHVVQVFGHGTFRGVRYYMMEFVAGRTLEFMRIKRKFSVEESARLVRDLARILSDIHRHRVIHRDIKPSNVILTDDGGLKLTDFGVARALEDQGLTLTREALGTPYYMSPEQIQGKKELVDHRTDIYSLGVMLYELLTFELPFRGENLGELTYSIVHAEAAAPSRRVDGLSPSLDVIVARAMEKDLKRRYPSAEDLAEDLDRFLEGRRVASSWSERIRKHSRIPRLAALAAAVVAVVGAAVVWGAPALRSLEGIPVMDPDYESRRIFDQAERLDGQGDWAGALDRYARLLRTPHSETAFVRKNQASIRALVAACQTEIRNASQAVRQEEWSAEELEKQGAWEEARLVWERLLERHRGIGPEQTARWRLRVRSCESERAALRTYADIQEQSRRHEWSRLQMMVQEFHDAYGETRTAALKSRQVEEYARKASRQMEARRRLEQLEELERLKKWEELGEALDRLRAYGDTDAYDPERIVRFKTRVEHEPGAQVLLQEIEQLYSAGAWREALRRTGEFQAKFGSTVTAAERSERLVLVQARCREKVADELERDAAAEWVCARNFLQSKNFELAAESCSRLADGEFQGTQFVRERIAEIRLLSRDIADQKRFVEAEACLEELRARHREALRLKQWKELYIAAHEARRRYSETPAYRREAKWVSEVFDTAVSRLFLEEFEVGAKGWRDSGGTVVLAGGGNPGLALKVSAGSAWMDLRDVPEEVDGVTFDARSLGPGTADLTLILGFRDMQKVPEARPKSSEDSLFTQVRITPAWTRIRIPLAKFQKPAGLMSVPRREDGSLQRALVYVGFSVKGPPDVLVDNFSFSAGHE